MARVLVPLADGCEEVEAITIIDLLRRAEIDVVTAGLKDGPVVGAHNVTITPDTTLDAALDGDYDMMVLPGGLPGADYLDADARVHAKLKELAAADKYTCAICAAPKVLANAGLLEGKSATCYPSFLDDAEGVNVTGGVLEQDGKVITSRGPGTAMDFALALIEALEGKTKRDEIEAGLVRP